MLSNMPPRTRCFIDANIFYYSLVSTPPLTVECVDFLKRVERREVAASTSSAAIAEATHKAIQFVVLLERGKGDSVAEIKEYWGESSIDEIHARIMQWKEQHA